jgi:hypothetical protein
MRCSLPLAGQEELQIDMEMPFKSKAISEHAKASPLSGTWEGRRDAFDRMEVSVQVVSS